MPSKQPSSVPNLELPVQILWFSAMFPYVVLSILFVKAVSLDGALDGISYLFTPEWHLLKEPQVWIGKGRRQNKTLSSGHVCKLGRRGGPEPPVRKKIV